MKKLAALLALVLALSVAVVPAFATEIGLEKYAEPLVVRFARDTDDTLDANFFSQYPDKTMTDNLWTDLYRDELNVIVEYDWIVKGGDEYNQKLNIALATGDIPEFIVLDKPLQVKQLAEAGMILPMDEIYEKYATPFAKEIMEIDGTAPFDAVTFDGQLWALPEVSDQLMLADVLWIRVDWLEKVGMEIPTTMDELLAAMDAFVNADFDGNGVKDTVGMGIAKDLWAGLFGLRGFFNAFGAFPTIWHEDAEGNLVYGSTTAETRAALAKLAEMYQKGYIDPEFGVKDGGKVAEGTTADKCGIAYGAQWNSIYPLQSSYDLTGADWQAVPIVSATGAPVKAQTEVGTTGWVVARHDVKNPEVLMKMFNLFMEKNWGATQENGIYYAPLDCESIWKLSPVAPTHPYKNLNAFLDLDAARASGDFSKVEGEAYSILKKLEAFEAGSEEGFAMWGWERIYGPEGAFGVLSEYQKAGLLQHEMFVGAPGEVMTERFTTLETMQDEVFTKIILGEAPIEDFDKFVEDFYKLGGTEITAEVNEWYQSVKK